MADSERDLVEELLTDLKRGKSNRKIDGRKVDAAMSYYNKVRDELDKYKPDTDDGESKPQTAFEKCQQDNIILKRELIEARNRLNAMPKDKRDHGGPGIQQVVEYNDPFRPSLLAEDFRSLYDSEWMQAYKELDTLKRNETVVLAILVNVIKGADQLCTSAMSQHLARVEQVALHDLKQVKVQLPGNKHGELMPDTGSVASKEETERSKRLIQEYIKSLGHLSITGLIQLFDAHYLQPIKTENDISCNLDKLNQFINKMIDILWKMKIGDPPLAFVWQESSEPFSKHLSTFYKKKGNQVVQPVWPTVLSRQGGPILYKGIVLAE